MGSLTSFLQQEFVRTCPSGWTGHAEKRVLPFEIERLVGYSPRADVLLERNDGSRRLWIELEVSRADPVANHVKFATAHLFRPFSASDVFVSMISSHVVRGRQNLAANTVHLMRRLGLNAFQTVLLPQFSGSQIKKLNHQPLETIHQQCLDTQSEIRRALWISEPVLTVRDRQLHFVGNIMEVLLNLHHWNIEVHSSEGHALWGQRTITYFVFDPNTRLFAPSKFCAYCALFDRRDCQTSEDLAGLYGSEMTIEFYAKLGDDRRFDGRRAWSHLVKNLAMTIADQGESARLLPGFDEWLRGVRKQITVHPRGPVFILPPRWFTLPSRQPASPIGM